MAARSSTVHLRLRSIPFRRGKAMSNPPSPPPAPRCPDARERCPPPLVSYDQPGKPLVVPHFSSGSKRNSPIVTFSATYSPTSCQSSWRLLIRAGLAIFHSRSAKHLPAPAEHGAQLGPFALGAESNKSSPGNTLVVFRSGRMTPECLKTGFGRDASRPQCLSSSGRDCEPGDIRRTPESP